MRMKGKSPQSSAFYLLLLLTRMKVFYWPDKGYSIKQIEEFAEKYKYEKA